MESLKSLKHGGMTTVIGELTEICSTMYRTDGQGRKEVPRGVVLYVKGDLKATRRQDTGIQGNDIETMWV